MEYIAIVTVIGLPGEVFRGTLTILATPLVTLALPDIATQVRHRNAARHDVGPPLDDDPGVEGRVVLEPDLQLLPDVSPIVSCADEVK
ncbi:MAG: hypothetical protein U0Q11_20630 [Vicinamibacterales bacterium]